MNSYKDIKELNQTEILLALNKEYNNIVYSSEKGLDFLNSKQRWVALVKEVKKRSGFVVKEWSESQWSLLMNNIKNNAKYNR